MEVKFAYSIADRVEIPAISMTGTIIALMIDSQGPSYLVAYWNDGQRYTTWLFDWEITGAP